MLPLSELLPPLSAEAPCGVDPALSTKLWELESLIRREVSMVGNDVAEEPDWKQVELQAQLLARNCKDLRVAGILTAAMIRSQGLEGLRSGLQLIREYLAGYWDSVFPLLDASDNNDPTERISVVANLAAPLGSDGDSLRIVEALRKITIIDSPQAGRFNLEHYLHSKGTLLLPGNNGTAPAPSLLEAALKGVGADTLAQTRALIQACLTEAKTIVSVFQERAGPASYPSMEPLSRELTMLMAWLSASPKFPPGIFPTDSSALNSSPGGTAETPRTVGDLAISGSITSRNEVLQALDALIAYYEKNEPASPIPLLLKRVGRLVPMNFLQLITELTPESTDKILSLTGRIEERAQ